MGGGDEWTCSQAAASLLGMTQILHDQGFTSSRLMRDQLPNVLARCKPCQSGKPCTGWRISLRNKSAVRFLPLPYQGKTLSVTVEGSFNSERTKPGDVELRPMKTSKVAIVVEEAGQRIARSHVDLAEPTQHGPVWHLQVGGLSSADHARPIYEWLDVPRWSTPPFDWVLATEMALFNFAFDRWRKLKKMAQWKDIVKRSENLLLRHYTVQLQEYWSKRNSYDSWLSAQCNRTGGWNPRPQ